MESRLPPELERQIFEVAAALYISSIPAFLRVARRVKIWIEPLLYRVLCIYLSSSDHEPQTLSLDVIHTMMDAKSASFFQAHVRHVQFTGYFPPQRMEKVLSVCKNVVNISLSDAIHWETPTLLRLLKALPLQQLSVKLQQLFPDPLAVDFSHTMFSNITHLEICDRVRGWETSWPGLALIPRLTHLSVDNDTIPNPIYQDVLECCKDLQVLVLVYETRMSLVARALARAELATDPRFVMLVWSSRRRWAEGVRTGDDCWARAEALVSQRRAGETDRYYYPADYD
ncbi:hypothetical protein DFH09DRAFT_1201308 [Mycena vulgaris]|nr:hypothetical protein DFH09DRAFT_1201308 [Mycena vulgaris]